MDSDERERHARFLRLYTQSEGALRVFVRSMLPTAEDAAEVMQEVAVVLWERFERYDPAREFRAWAFGVARLQALMFLRRARSERRFFDEALVQMLADTAQEAADVHEQQREALETCLRRLPAGRRELVLEAYARGARIDQLAKNRGQTAMALYKILHRIRISLLECMRGVLGRESAYE
jgi:RNA polymerase sigma-70 factor (ECF subfamily)